MDRLVTFGCSFTYGTALEEQTDAWPYVAGKTLSKEVINKAVPGSSNLRILCEVLKFDFKDNDVVVIMWSLPLRDLQFRNNGYQEIGVWSKGPQINKMLIDGATEDYTKKTWVYMQHADLYLQTKNVKYIHYPATLDIMKYQLDFVNINNLFLTRTEKIDDATDKQHPGPKSHKKQADEIARILINEEIHYG